LDEIEQSLALDVTPASWPLGMGRDFLGTYDLFADALLCSSAASTTGSPSRSAAMASTTLELARRLPKAALAKLREEVEMAKGLCLSFEAYRERHLTPVYFGSPLNDFGVRELLRGIAELAPASRPQPALGAHGPRPISPDEPGVAGFAFEVRANLNETRERS
jgi:peptide chain release factor 3